MPYKVIKDTPFCKVGDIVYDLKEDDYGLAFMNSIDEPHISVTYSPKGDYPCVTIPRSALEQQPKGKNESCTN